MVAKRKLPVPDDMSATENDPKVVQDALNKLGEEWDLTKWEAAIKELSMDDVDKLRKMLKGTENVKQLSLGVLHALKFYKDLEVLENRVDITIRHAKSRMETLLRSGFMKNDTFSREDFLKKLEETHPPPTASSSTGGSGSIFDGAMPRNPPPTSTKEKFKALIKASTGAGSGAV